MYMREPRNDKSRENLSECNIRKDVKRILETIPVGALQIHKIEEAVNSMLMEGMSLDLISFVMGISLKTIKSISVGDAVIKDIELKRHDAEAKYGFLLPKGVTGSPENIEGEIRKRLITRNPEEFGYIGFNAIGRKYDLGHYAAKKLIDRIGLEDIFVSGHRLVKEQPVNDYFNGTERYCMSTKAAHKSNEKASRKLKGVKGRMKEYSCYKAAIKEERRLLDNFTGNIKCKIKEGFYD